MRNRASILAALLLSAANSVPSQAGVSPFVRLEYGFNGLAMDGPNARISQNETALRAAGSPADFEKIGPGVGPSGSLGVWLTPSLRVGATYSYLRSYREHRLHEPGAFWGEDIDLQMREFGGEVAVRMRRLAGLTLGGSFASGRAKLIDGFTIEDGAGNYYEDTVSEGDVRTYGGYLGFDQTNAAGVAGYVRLGYQHRDAGALPMRGTASDGVTTVEFTDQSVPLDYSGIYFRIGMGFDLVR